MNLRNSHFFGRFLSTCLKTIKAVPKATLSTLDKSGKKNDIITLAIDIHTQARVAELADAQDLKSCDLTVVRVQVPPRVLEKIRVSASLLEALSFCPFQIRGKSEATLELRWKSVD